MRILIPASLPPLPSTGPAHRRLGLAALARRWGVPRPTLDAAAKAGAIQVQQDGHLRWLDEDQVRRIEARGFLELLDPPPRKRAPAKAPAEQQADQPATEQAPPQHREQQVTPRFKATPPRARRRA